MRCTHSLQLTAPQAAASMNTSPADDHQNKSIHTTSSAVPPVPCPIRICHRPDLTWHFLIWKTPAECGCLAVILAQTFEHTLRGTRWTRHESRCFFRCILLCFWSVFVQHTVLCQPVICFVVFLVPPVPSAPSRKPLPTVFDPSATVTFVCSSCFLPLKPNPSVLANVYFGSCVQKKPSAFHPTFLCKNSTDVRKPGPMFSQIFTSRSSALSSGTPKMKSFPPCTPSASSFLHVRRKHLTRVTSSVETLEQSPDLSPSCESPLVAPRRSPCALSHGRTPPKCQTQR